MSEEPKSIWKKSWTGWGWLWAWLILVVATFLIVLVIGLFIPDVSRSFPGGAALGFSLVVGMLAGVAVGLVGFIGWLFHWRNFKRFLFALACFATLVALFYAEEDWRGWHDWNQFKRQGEAKGEHFSFASVVPPPVPDDQNFAFSPVWIAVERFRFQNEPKRAEAWYGNRIYSEEVSRFLPLLPVSVSGLVGTNWAYQSDETPKMPGQWTTWTTARLADLKPWQSYYRGFEKTNPEADIPITPQPQSPAQDVLLALSKFDPVFEQLRADSARPFSRFPIGYENENKAAILLPHLAAVKRFAMVLQLRALAELQNGQSEKALGDVKLMLRLTDSIRNEPIIISQLVRFAVFQLTLQPIYEGLAEHKWSDAQLADLSAALSRPDFLAGYELSARGERNAHINIINWLEQKPSRCQELFNMGLGDDQEFLVAAVFYLMPKGWYYQNDILLAQEEQQWILPVVNDANQTVSPKRANQADAAIKLINRHLTPFNFLALQLLSALRPFAIRTAHTQASADLARVAIALERYRLAHGSYPESLDALAPQFIKKVPHDVIGGGPLHYRLTSDGQFVLYSIGWNERDDGGVVGLTEGGSVDSSKGDWVWRYPEK